MRRLLENQRAACVRDGLPAAEIRIERLDKSIDLLCTHSDALCAAMSADFGHRSTDQSRFSDIIGSIDALKYAKKNVRSWMRPEKRSTLFPLGLFGARAAVHYQPKGVVGVQCRRGQTQRAAREFEDRFGVRDLQRRRGR